MSLEAREIKRLGGISRDFARISRGRPKSLRKKSLCSILIPYLKIKFLGGTSLGHQGPTRRDIPDPGPGMSRAKTLCKEPSSVVLDREWPGCPAIWVGTSRDRKTFMQENSGLIFRSLIGC